MIDLRRFTSLIFAFAYIIGIYLLGSLGRNHYQLRKGLDQLQLMEKRLQLQEKRREYTNAILDTESASNPPNEHIASSCTEESKFKNSTTPR